MKFIAIMVLFFTKTLVNADLIYRCQDLMNNRIEINFGKMAIHYANKAIVTFEVNHQVVEKEIAMVMNGPQGNFGSTYLEYCIGKIYGWKCGQRNEKPTFILYFKNKSDGLTIESIEKVYIGNFLITLNQCKRFD